MRSWKLLFLAAFFLAAGMTAEARERDVDSAERLRYLNQATGRSGPVTGPPDSFQTRLDAIFDVNATPENTTIAAEDEEMRQARLAAALQNKIGVDAAAQKKWDDERGRQRMRVDDTAERGRLNSTEKAYQQALDLQAEEDEAREKTFKPRTLAVSDDASSAPSSGMSRALANNPFYFPAAGAEAKKFDQDKPVVLSRLVEIGYDRADAERIINRTSSPEELVMVLMEDENYTYGEASDIANV